MPFTVVPISITPLMVHTNNNFGAFFNEDVLQ